MKIKPILILVIFLATFLRLQSIWYIEFKGDEAANSFLAVDFVYKGIFPLVGDMSSQGPYNPPMFIYLLTIPFLFSKNPVVASSYIALLNILAIYICFLFCREFFNERAALIATAFFSVNPWVILHSRKIWANNLLSLFVIIFFYSLYKVIFKKQNKYILLSFASLAIFTQLHLSTICYLILLFAVIIIFRLKIEPLYYILGLSTFFFLYIPYILYDIKNNFYNLNAFLIFSKLPFKIRLDAFLMPFKLTTTSGFEDSLGASFNEFISQVFYSSFLNFIQVSLIITAIIYLFYHMLSDKKYLILILWFFIPIIFICFSKNYFGRAAFISLYPVQFIMVGILIDALNNKIRNYSILSGLSFFVVFIIVIYQLIFSINFDKFIKTKKCIYGDYGPPFKYRVEEIKKLIKEGNTDIESIHQKVSLDKRCYKYDFIATKYIVENINAISK